MGKDWTYMYIYVGNMYRTAQTMYISIPVICWAMAEAFSDFLSKSVMG